MQFNPPCMRDVDCANNYYQNGYNPPNFYRYICKRQGWKKEMPPPCEAGWTRFNGNCYKHIVRENNDRVNFDEAAADCGEKYSYLAPATSQEERDFLIQLGSRPGNWSVKVDALVHFPQSPSLIGGGPKYADYLLLGAGRVSGQKAFYWFNSTSTWFGTWCSNQPNYYTSDLCLSIQSDPVCMWDVNCENDYARSGRYPSKFLHYVCKKPLCHKEETEPKSDGTCGCKEEYWDITDLSIPEGEGYQKGEKCILRMPCMNLTDLTIVFVVDSSKSIGTSNWENMITFLQSGSHLLNNTVNVGFVKFSTDVTASEWLPKLWTEEQYLTGTPNDYDAGERNTPAAFDSARQLFTELPPGNKAAVLITHGLPAILDVDKESAIEKTSEAAKQLRRGRIDLVALGYGEKLREHAATLKKLLSNPRTDYFQFDGEAEDLKEMHMSYLLDKVCKRFK